MRSEIQFTHGHRVTGYLRSLHYYKDVVSTIMRSELLLFLISQVGPPPFDLVVKLLCCASYVLLFAFGAGDEIDDVGRGAG